MKEEELSILVMPLLEWYNLHKRSLPWRDQPDPYYVWVSEIMLQQTRVETVIPYFHRFTTALPTIQDLAEASEEQLHKLWEGLGYYSRVRNLKKGAMQVMERFGGKLPADYHDLLSLSGIGSYTAGAIASIAFGLPTPAVDGNALRVFSRVLELDEDIKGLAMKKRLEGALGLVIPQAASGDFNQAIMDIGSGVCLSRSQPLCEECPLNFGCGAYQAGTTASYPVQSPKKKRTIEELTVLVISDGKNVLVEKRPNQGLLAGLWQFPNLPEHLSLSQVQDYLAEKGLVAQRITSLSSEKHIFTHKEWWMEGYYIKVTQLQEGTPIEKLFADYGMAGAFHAYKKILEVYDEGTD